MPYPKRLIEVDLPIKRISAHARREKSIRHGHISTLHIWWARRPLAACRAVICAALWPDPAGDDPPCPQSFREAAARIITEFARNVATRSELMDTCSRDSFARWEALTKPDYRLDPKDTAHLNILRFALLDFIADFANWDNSTVPEYLETARALTQAAHEALGGEPGTRPLVVDPFAGGGSIPLEALRVGADAFASDLNPVAVLLNKVVLEYIPKYGQRLADEVRKWGKWVKEQAAKELASYYPKDQDGATPIAYLWARTILSEAPGQGKIPVEVPLLRSMSLAKKKGRNRALRWLRNQNGEVMTQVVEKTFADGATRKVRQPLLEIFEPRNEKAVESGTSSGGSATCPVTGFTMPVERVRAQLKSRQGGALDSRLLCVVTVRPGKQGRHYRLSTESDREAAILASQQLYARSSVEDGFQLPDGRLNHLRGFFNVVLYGMETWGTFFTPRQGLTLSVLVKYVVEAGKKARTTESEEAIAVQTCLAMVVDRQANTLTSLSRWNVVGEKIEGLYSRQALPMVWDFAEANPFSSATGSFDGALEWVENVCRCESCLTYEGRPSGQAEQCSATAHTLPTDSAAAVISDPPYYAAVPYADLSDFFYSWLRRSLGNCYPSLLTALLTPKAEECVQLSHRAAMYREKDAPWFENKMRDACAEAARYVVPHGIGMFVFANKETLAWEAMLSALVESSWTVTASWPIDTEMASRLRAHQSAVLGSSIHIVCRPRESAEIGEWRDVLNELPARVTAWLPRLAQEGIVGADAIFACLGPALEIFSRYARVEKASGEPVTLKEYLEQVWAAVAKEALSMIFAGADVTGFDPDARLTAMWFWTLSTGASGNFQSVETTEQQEAVDDEDSGKVAKMSGYVLEYDAARKIAQGLGAHLEQLTSVIEVKGDKARLLPVSERARQLFGKDEGKAPNKREKKPKQRTLFDESGDGDGDEVGWGEMNVPVLGTTILDRLHQGMILFAAGRSEALKRFLVEEGVGRDVRLWRLAQALSALYPGGTEEKRWVDGVLARKKGLGF